MNTLLLAPELFGSNGGIPRTLRLYLKALCDLADPADHVRFVALNDRTVDGDLLREYSNERLDTWRACGYSKLGFVGSALRQAMVCERLVCGHVAQLPVAWLGSLLNPRLRYYLVAHGIEVWRPFTAAERMALRGAHGIFCVSEFTRDQMLQNLSLDPARLVVLHNALDPRFVIGPGQPLTVCPPTILTVSRLTYADRYKGIDSLIEAMPAIRKEVPGATLRVVGSGDDLGRLQSLANSAGLLGTGVEFLGFLDDRQLDVQLRGCRLFALPSKGEGFGLALIEAMAHGRPCIGARAGGLPEVISSDSGVLIEYGDVAGIAAGCVGALRRDWAEAPILDRARSFSYSPFKQRLASLLSV